MHLKIRHRWWNPSDLQFLIFWSLLCSPGWLVYARGHLSQQCEARTQPACLKQALGNRPGWLSTDLAIRSRQERAERLRETVLLYESGVATPVSRFFAQRRGYTLVDLSDHWVPRLLRANDVRGTMVQSAYAAQYIALSNDKHDIEGRPLAPGEQNDLEVFGISPSVRAARVFLFRRAGCLQEALRRHSDGRVRLFFYGEQAALDVRLARQKAYVDALLKKNPGTDAKTLAMKNRRFKALYTRYETLKLKHDVVAFIEDKLVCEGVMAPRRRGQRTRLNQRLAEGIRRFQRRHKISDSKLMSPATVAANVAASNKFYGGARPDLLSPPATRVLYPNGNVDPCASPPSNTRRRPSGDETRRACGSGGLLPPLLRLTPPWARPPVSGQGTGSRSSPRPRRSCLCSSMLQAHRPDSLGQPARLRALPVS